MTSGRTTLVEGARVLTDSGTAVVVETLAGGVGLRDSLGCVAHVGWPQLDTVRSIADGHVAALTEKLGARSRGEAVAIAIRAGLVMV